MRKTFLHNVQEFEEMLDDYRYRGTYDPEDDVPTSYPCIAFHLETEEGLLIDYSYPSDFNIYPCC